MLLTFLLLDGTTIQINNSFVANLSPVPLALLPVGVPAGTYIDQPGEVRIGVQGTLAAVSAILAAGSTTPFSSDGYAPVFTPSGGGIIGSIGTWRALRIGTRVLVLGEFFFTSAVAGVAENIKFSLPASIPPVPALFVNTFDLNGIASGPVAPDTATPPAATVGSATGNLNVATGAFGAAVSVCFGYDA